MTDESPSPASSGASRPPHGGDEPRWIRAVRSPITWIVLAAVYALAILGMAANAQGRQWQVESTAYVRRIVPAICTAWDAEELKRQAAPELFPADTDSKLTEYFGAFSRRLGPLKEISEPVGGISFNLGTTGLQWVAAYQVPAQFEHAKGVVQLRLTREHGEWKIASFFVYSDALMP